jgi:NAD(P)-dependent dehydrogenase (short-subunit alcohol dehydrogenase family)
MANKIIVMTGGSSGFGQISLKKFLQTQGLRIILGVRNGKVIEGAETIDLDLSNLTKVCSFAQKTIQKLGTNKINALVLNAGTNNKTIDSRTVDGYETTFAVNHLAHYLLIRLLLPYMANGGTIVITTSGTHDPAEKTKIAPPKHANALLLAHPENDSTLDKDQQVNAGRSYSSSKLCNILTARFLISTPFIQNNQISVIAYDPGPTPGTGLVRNTDIAIRILWKFLGFSIIRALMPHFNSRKASGEALAKIALNQINIPEGYFYAALRKGKMTWPSPSELAMNDQVMELLWKDSAKLVGLSE